MHAAQRITTDEEQWLNKLIEQTNGLLCRYLQRTGNYMNYNAHQ